MTNVVLTWGAATDPGRLRPDNQDGFLARPPVFVVADGMGGHAAGEVASALTIERFEALAVRGSVESSDVPTVLTEANTSILDSVIDVPSRAGMGTTVVGLLLLDDPATESGYWLAFNVGDSRIYRFHDDQLEQVSVDHSEVQELVDSGELSATQAREHPRRNVVTRALGSVSVPTADCWLRAPVRGERFLLCSDGLSGEVTDEQIASLLTEHRDAERAADALVALALASGGRDNVTVLVVDVENVASGALPGADPDIDVTTTPREHLPSDEATVVDPPTIPLSDLADLLGADDVDADGGVDVPDRRGRGRITTALRGLRKGDER